ncbi:ATP-binding protein [Lewinella sp. JB7]|uniref:ATP-binding protein n=1 Tax=Lewinella sp. JB7 TaxID=2962887 RepID=UPI0020C9D987|nr:ATP-binding protein [Lewinella sp. JB7]MCP9237186.1 ATP-binding protein [Lewinella sp. JB7]
MPPPSTSADTQTFGPLKRKMLDAGHGTPEQQAAYREWKAARARRLEERRLQDEVKFLEKCEQLDLKRSDKELILQASKARMHRTLNRRYVGRRVDAADAYQAARQLIYMAYQRLVMDRTGAPPAFTGRQEIITLLHRLAHWLVGDEICTCPEPVDCIPVLKSVLVYGPPGNGKSTVAEAAAVASVQLSHAYDTGMRLGYRNFDNVMMTIRTSQSLAPVEELCRSSLVLDEIRENHLTYTHYGDRVSLMYDLLMVRYQNWVRDGVQTVITSNLRPDDLARELERNETTPRLTDRLIEQYEMVAMRGDSFRRRVSAASAGPNLPAE